MQGRNPQLFDAGAMVEVGGDGADVGHGCGGRIGQLAPFGGQGHPARVALEQDHTQVGLQFADVVADRAGGEVQLLRGVGEILVPGGGCEYTKGRQEGGAQVHGDYQSDTSQICGCP